MKNYLLLIFMFLAVSGLKAEDAVLAEFVGASEEEGSTFDGVNYDYVSFSFTRAVTVDHAYIVLEDENKIELSENEIDIFTAYRCNCRFIILDRLKALRQSGKLPQGNTFKILIEGVKDAATSTLLTPSDYSLSLVAGRIILGDVINVNPISGSTIKPFYPLDGTEGKITFTFSEPVTAESAMILYGDVEDEKTFGSTALPTPEYSDKTVTVDLRGISMYPSDIKGNTSFTLQLAKIKTLDGISAKGNIPGSAGTYAVNYNVKSQGDVEIFPNFTPNANSVIDNVEEIKCWFNVKVAFDAVKYSYNLGGATTSFELPVNGVRIEDDPKDKDAMYVYIPVKDLAFDAGNVKIEFVNLVDMEGYRAIIEETFSSEGKTPENVGYIAANPTSGALESAKTFNFIFGDVVNVDVDASKMVINGVELALTAGGVTVINSGENKNVVSLTTRGALYGDFSFVLKVKDASGNAITYGDAPGFVSENYSYFAYKCTQIEPKEGNVTSLKTFTLTFTNVEDDADYVGGINPANQIRLIDSQNRETLTSFAIADGEYPAQIIVTLPEEVSESGTYDLVLPGKSVINSGFDGAADDLGISFGAYYNPEQVFEYIIEASGIDVPTVSSLSGEVEVYSIQGVLLRKADVSVALKGLAKGIYIVGGKKVAVE